MWGGIRQASFEKTTYVGFEAFYVQADTHTFRISAGKAFRSLASKVNTDPMLVLVHNACGQIYNVVGSATVNPK